MPATKQSLSFPKTARLLKPAEFRRVYDEGTRITGPFFAAFCLRRTEGDGPRVGFTVPRALGGSVVRNRIKRRMREAVRGRLSGLGPGWCIVFNPRRAACTAPFQALTREVERLFSRCNG